ncbi:surface antigen [Plasmodium falciparum UGT5.1]|uniref:Surface antigen n=1 Tax=Plasmodium falciparum UGT5.1 TaxID=1237627 RepID=W7JKC9_PLAFA|nr:surface antigen [Plasmodium falciparum UGT5.1]
MQQFGDRTSQRFHEYDERMKNTRQKCKEQCDKEIQKIILKDKLEKQMEEQLTTLETKIDTDDIPTCICEKSIADKVEKTCLKCGGVLGGGVMPGFGTIGGTALYALNLLKPAAIEAAKDAAVTEATKAATQAGIEAVILKIEEINNLFSGDPGFFNLVTIVNESTYKNSSALVATAKKVIGAACKNERGNRTSFYNTVIHFDNNYNIKNFAQAGSSAFEKTLESETATLTKAKVGAVESTYTSWQIAITASVIAIVVIVLIMVIIYLILRYRRKKKMKKKLQYIKLLEE